MKVKPVWVFVCVQVKPANIPPHHQFVWEQVEYKSSSSQSHQYTSFSLRESSFCLTHGKFVKNPTDQ